MSDVVLNMVKSQHVTCIHWEALYGTALLNEVPLNSYGDEPCVMAS